jgi:hypothetical protein
MEFLTHNQLAPNTDWDAAMNALIVGSDGAPQFRQHFLVVNDVGWLGMPNTSIGGAESFPMPGKHASYIEVERLPQLFSIFRKQNATISLAIRQLESSRRRLSDVERAIDLGICLEVLLMSGAKENGEIGYKLSTRAAWLIGETPDKREEAYEAARILYNRRSSAAHTGALRARQNMEEEEAHIAEFKKFDVLCASLIVHLAERGFPKDWKSVVLGFPAM